MIYWGADNDATVLILVLSALSIYFSVDIARVTKGAPKAWYVFIAAFGTWFAYKAVLLYFDTMYAPDIIDDWEAAISLVMGFLLLLGLVMLDRSFRRQVRRTEG